MKRTLGVPIRDVLKGLEQYIALNAKLNHTAPTDPCVVTYFGVAIERGDLLHCPEGTFTVTRVDKDGAKIICLGSDGTYYFNFEAFHRSHVIHEPRNRPGRPVRQSPSAGIVDRSQWPKVRR